MKKDAPSFGEQLPRMVVEPPGPKSRDMAERLRHSEIPAASSIKAGAVPVFWDRTAGCNIEDVDGNRYVDISGGFFVTNVGHSNPRVVKAIADQSKRMLHSMGCINPNPPRLELAEKLKSITPPGLDVSYIANTGGESVDMALKTARLYTGKNTVLAFQGGFHGKTLASLGATAQNYFREPWESLLTNFVHLPYAYCYRCPFRLDYPDCGLKCAQYFEHVVEYPSSGVTDIAAVIFEPVQGQGGIIIPPPEFLTRVVEICRRNNILVIADEIITGFGRTGRLFGCELAEFVPDILVLGKGMASGFPISACVTTPSIASAWQSDQHTSTFLGHPIGCAAALACIRELEDKDLVRRAASMGSKMKELLEPLRNHRLVGDIRDVGLMAAVELVRDRSTREPASEEAKVVVQECLKKGLMATLRGGAFGNCLRVAPSLVITEEQMEFACRTLDECLGIVETESK